MDEKIDRMEEVSFFLCNKYNYNLNYFQKEEREKAEMLSKLKKDERLARRKKV